MSEYQYYEFLALDRPLTDKQLGELRSLSTRAEISATRFVNEYHWGNDADTEPPVPAGLGKLSAPLRAVADFLDIDQDLLAAAAQASPDAREDDHDGLAAWSSSLKAQEKDALLARVAAGEASVVQALLSRRFRRERGGHEAAAKALPVTLVLSGSALTLMEQLLERGAPLFGRATARPRLEPLDYRDAAGFAADQEPEALLRRWAVLGGTPQYQVWAGSGPLEDVITSRILSKDAALYDEPRHLLREGEGIRDPGTYLSILRAIANGATQHNEIAQQAKAASASLAPKLARLGDLGCIERRYPLTADEREQRPGYPIEDPFFRFWFCSSALDHLRPGAVHPGTPRAVRGRRHPPGLGGAAVSSQVTLWRDFVHSNT